MLIPELHAEPAARFASLEGFQGAGKWYAVHTKARHEKKVAAQWEEKCVCGFLPLLRQVRRWSDRKALVEVPMFSCYAFVHTTQAPEARLKVLRTPGVLGFVGAEGQGTPVPDEQIESLQSMLRQGIPFFPYPYLRAGNRVRIRGGSLDGVEGIFVRTGAEQSLVISIELLQRSVAVRVDGYDVELVA